MVIHLSHFVEGVVIGWVCGRVCWLCGVWGMRQAWHWRDYLETYAPPARPGVLALPTSIRRQLFQAFVRERLGAWIASLSQGFHPALTWKERVTIWGVQYCLLLVTIGAWGPLVVLGLESQTRRRWCGLPVRLVSRWQRTLHARLTTVSSTEVLLKRVALASLYTTVEDVPEAAIASHPNLFRLDAPEEKGPEAATDPQPETVDRQEGTHDDPGTGATRE